MPPTSLYPLTFAPFFRPMPWGGRRLRDWFPHSYPADETVGEAWLLSDHPLHASRVLHGPLAGTTLRHLIVNRCVDLLGKAAERFPLLIKLLDANENLSIQVHPDDEAARSLAPAEGGKTEAWVILNAEAGASLYLGLKRGIDAMTVRRELHTGNLPLCLNRFQPKPGECWFVPAGTIHALGGGLVVLEVQQTSDATFRLHDWGRVGSDGKPRALHIEQGIACLKPEIDGAALQCMPQRESPERLVECPYFGLSRYRGPCIGNLHGPSVLLLLEGEARLQADGFQTSLNKEQPLLLPACMAGQMLVEQGCVVLHAAIKV